MKNVENQDLKNSLELLKTQKSEIVNKYYELHSQYEELVDENKYIKEE